MQTKERQNMYLPIIVFLLIGGIFVGTEMVAEPVEYISAHEECAKYFSDDDGDGDQGFIEDNECHKYPYADGTGETWNGQTQQANSNYQIYWDLSVDLVRYFVEIECNGQIANCLGTNFITEVQFFCWFDQNIMKSSWYAIYDKAFNQHMTIQDDGSMNYFLNTCNAFPPSNQPSTLPDAGTQQSSALADNPNGSPNGGGGMK